MNTLTITAPAARPNFRKLLAQILTVAIGTTLATLFVALIFGFFGEVHRADLESMSKIDLFFLAVVWAPIVETLALQSFPVWLLSQFSNSRASQFICACLPFALVHFNSGVAIGSGVGVVCGVGFGCALLHYKKVSLGYATCVVMVIHAFHNAMFFAWAGIECQLRAPKLIRHTRFS